MESNLKSFEIIEWLDHATYSKSEWRSSDEIKNLSPIHVVTLGFVVAEDKTCIKVASTVSDEGHYASEFLILKKVIIRRKQIKNPWKGWSND